MRNTTTIQNPYHPVFQHLFSVCLACLSTLLIYSFSHAAGITTDGSMGVATTLIPAGNAYTISADLGQQIGTNLFHSFGNFNVDTGYSATFTGPAGTTNVIGRVTGGNPSSIDGKLACTIDGANLWLLNPFGILFGSHASLDVKGSFYASTADFLQLSGGGVFYTNPSKTSTLTTAPPSAFGFLNSNPAGIEVNGSTLSVHNGESLSIIGGDIRIENGFLFAPGGRVNLASLGSPGTVGFVSDGLKVEAANGLGNICIANSTLSNDRPTPDDSSVDSCSMAIYCKTFSLTDNSFITSANYSMLNKGGEIRIVAEESASIDNSSIFNGCYGKADGGDIDIQAGSLALTNGGQLLAFTYGSGDAGDIGILAKNVWVDGVFENSYGFSLSKITSLTNPGSSGNAGNITIDTESLILSNGGLTSTSTFGNGDGGNITIRAKNVCVDGGIESSNDFTLSKITSQTNPDSSGNAGSIAIDTESLILSNGAQLSAAALGSGNGGNIAISSKYVSVDGGFESSSGSYLSKISSQTESGGIAGGLNIDTESLSLTHGGQISASTFGSGDGGNISINAKHILVDGGYESSNDIYLSGIICQANPDSTGNAGSLNIDTESLLLSNGGRLVAAAFGSGNGGNIAISSKYVSVDGGFESSSGFYPTMISCQTESAGNAGSLNIDTESLKLTHGGQISASTLENGDGGNISIRANNVWVDGGFESSDDYSLSMITCQAESKGDAGSMNIETECLTLSNGGRISADTYGSGNGGDVTIKAKDVSIDGGFESNYSFDPSKISCKALFDSSGKGGNISLDADTLTLSNGAVISSASSGAGNAGNINLTVAGKLEIRDSAISTASIQVDGGDITINTGSLVWLVDSAVTATVGGGPQTTGGNIRINSPDVVLNNSQVIANAYEGKGGSIGITAGTYLADWTSTVTASSTLGINGQVDINSPPVNLSGLLSPLPAGFVDISELLANDCETRYKHRKASSLVVRGRDALPAQPGDLCPSPIMMQ